MKEEQTDVKRSKLSTKQIVVFKLGQEEYGLSIDQIKEVVLTPAITPMPQTPVFVKGVANIRGNIVALLDLEEKFGIVQESNEKKVKHGYALVIESDEYKMGILVREVPNTLTISSSDVEELAVALEQNADQSYITGIVKLEKRLIIMIDIFKVIQRDGVHKFLGRQNSTVVEA